MNPRNKTNGLVWCTYSSNTDAQELDLQIVLVWGNKSESIERSKEFQLSSHDLWDRRQKRVLLIVITRFIGFSCRLQFEIVNTGEGIV